jgi:hypothetical protein
VPHDLRDQLVDFMRHYTTLTELPTGWFLDRIPLARRQY